MGNRIYVGNLSWDTNEEALRSAFAADGRNVKEVNIMTDRDTGRPRGFAFVEMASGQDAQNAITALDGAELDGRNIKVNEAQERQPRSGGGGGGGGGGRGGVKDRLFRSTPSSAKLVHPGAVGKRSLGGWHAAV
jgi:cold-inducible RNA-binding protein